MADTDDHTDPLNAERLQRLLEGGLPPSEITRLRQEIAAATGREDALDAALDAVRAEGMWQDFTRRRVAAGYMATRRRFMTAPEASLRWRSAYGIAAAIIVIVAGALVTWRQSLRPAEPFHDFASAAGKRVTLAMRDGSRIVLGPASRIRVPSDFGSATRVVDLTGEAEFSVVHDGRHPFTVRTGRTIIRDIGTTFAVRAYADDAVDRIAVVEGQVSLEGRVPWASSSRSATLVAGDMAAATDSAATVVHAAHLAAMTAWVQGGLAFEETPLRYVVRDIGRAFDVDIVVADTVLDGRHVTASFAQESLEVVLKTVTEVVGAHYERSGRSIVIRRGTDAGRPDLRRVTRLKELHVPSR